MENAVEKYVEGARGCQPGWRTTVDGLLDRLLPRQCVVCGLAAEALGLCQGCRSGLPWCSAACPVCGLPLPTGAVPACGACLDRPPPFQSLTSAFWYEFPIRKLLWQYKFHRNLAAGHALCGLLAGRLVQLGPPRPDYLVPVPLHGLRLFRRGFNQAFDLARVTGSQANIPLLARSLRRTRHTRQQAGLEARARRGNLRQAFAWRGRPLDGEHLALIDDVMTTGATARECVTALKRAGAGRIDVWVLARAVH